MTCEAKGQINNCIFDLHWPPRLKVDGWKGLESLTGHKYQILGRWDEVNFCIFDLLDLCGQRSWCQLVQKHKEGHISIFVVIG